MPNFSAQSNTFYRLFYDGTVLNISSVADLDGLQNGIIVASGTAVMEYLDTGSLFDVGGNHDMVII